VEGHPVLSPIPTEPVKVPGVVLGVEENGLATIAAGHHVVEEIWSERARLSGHGYLASAGPKLPTEVYVSQGLTPV
jgi:hypothetical protein